MVASFLQESTHPSCVVGFVLGIRFLSSMDVRLQAAVRCGNFSFSQRLGVPSILSCRTMGSDSGCRCKHYLRQLACGSEFLPRGFLCRCFFYLAAFLIFLLST